MLATLLFNVYIHDFPETTSNKYGYTDDLTIILHISTWEAVDIGLKEDMNIPATYLNRWRLQLSTGKAFNLNHKESNCVLSVFENKQAAPNYLGVKLDRTPTFRQQHAHQPPCWYPTRNCSQDPTHLYPGTGFFYGRLLRTSLGQDA